MRSYDNHNPNFPVESIAAPVGSSEAADAYREQLSGLKVAELRKAAADAQLPAAGSLRRKADLVEALADWLAAHPAEESGRAKAAKATTRKQKGQPASKPTKRTTGKAATPVAAATPEEVEAAKPVSPAAKGFAAQGIGHSTITKRIMAARTPQGKASVVVEIINEFDGWAATLNGDQAVLAKSRDGRKITVDYPDTGHPAVRVFDSPEHGGRRQPNVSGALRWLKETQPATPAKKATTRRKAAAKK